MGDDELEEDNDHVKTVRTLAQKDGSGVVVISGKLESEISDLDSPEEKIEFLTAAGLEEFGGQKPIGFRLGSYLVSQGDVLVFSLLSAASGSNGDVSCHP